MKKKNTAKQKQTQTQPQKYSYDYLKEKERERRDEHFPCNMGLRVHRAISWVGLAEKCDGTDFDSKFIFLWIAFNAAYADATTANESAIPQPAKKAPPGTKERNLGERSSFEVFFRKIAEHDSEGVVSKAMWDEFSGPVRVLMNNKFVYKPFWEFQHGNKNNNWKERHESDNKRFNKNFKKDNMPGTLRVIFDRLYELRNQIMHGGSTWNSEVNREQVRGGANILGFLMPVFIDIMMDNPKEDWGAPYYPNMSK